MHDWIVPIPGTTRLERLEENVRSADLEFTPEEWRDLNYAVSKIKLQGDRYPADEENKSTLKRYLDVIARRALVANKRSAESVRHLLFPG